MNFYEKLIASGKKLIISEVGLGVPITNGLTRTSGASNVLLYAQCPYNREYQYNDTLPSVSLGHVCYQAEELVSIGKFLVLATSGAYKKPSERGDTHLWAVIDSKITNSSYMHFSIAKMHIGSELEVTRNEAVDLSEKALALFIGVTLDLPEYRAKLTPIPGVEMPREICIDVFEVVGVSFINKLKFVSRSNPLLFHNGKFHRAIDYIRNYKTIFRGSFNPPHAAHLEMGKGSLFELSIDNARKGLMDWEDLAKRVKFLDTYGVPILITRGCPFFVDLTNMLRKRGIEERLTYVVGSDTMEAIVADAYCPTPDYLLPLIDVNGVDFTVYCRGGNFPVFNDRIANLKCSFVEFADEKLAELSSTAIRNAKDE